jgi:hypothetical protein
MFEYIEAFYNRRRRHSRLGMLSPVDYENSSHTLDGVEAASRLAHTDKIITTTTSRPPRPPKETVSTEPGDVHCWLRVHCRYLWRVERGAAR